VAGAALARALGVEVSWRSDFVGLSTSRRVTINALAWRSPLGPYRLLGRRIGPDVPTRRPRLAGHHRVRHGVPYLSPLRNRHPGRVSELPPDPDLDDLPDEIERADGPLTIVGEDEHGNVWSAPITREELAAAFADRRRALEDEQD
jgi:hypothetical protein